MGMTFDATLKDLGRDCPNGILAEDGLASVVQKLVHRLAHQAQHEQSIELLTTALLLSGLRVSRNVALRILRGIPTLEESDTYLMILEQGEDGANHAPLGGTSYWSARRGLVPRTNR